eukprot:TRINITY_DN17713_c0_g1_i1.p1 TRINITY_DN17713_c0_g1~~TRINITY_DN17713_c0_g1_i1.p1  ORF type:complete len:1623 (+),score=324.64 TRINITY_DN17713_c0_g1_i1:48-4871(+)
MVLVRRGVGLFIVLLVSTVDAAFPQCQTMYDQCLYQHVGNEFAELQQRLLSPAGRAFTESEMSTLCNSTNWLLRDQCYSDCPLHLQITEPAEYRMRICLRGNNFLPFSPDNHIDVTHPIHGVEMEIVRPGALNDPTSEKGCKASDYLDKDYNNKIVLLSHGDCYEAEKFVAAASADAAAAIDYNWRYMKSVDSNLNFISEKLVGRSEGFESLPALGMALHQGGPLMDILNKGVKVFGKIVLQCTFPDVSQTASVRCPNPALRGMCDSPDLAPRDRLCNRCGSVLEIPSGNQTSEYCLFDNDLQPVKGETLFQDSHSLPAIIPLALFNPSKLPIGCKTEDWMGFEGKYVTMENLIGCVHAEAIVAAQEAGVVGVIYLGDPGRGVVEMLTGNSELINIPVHSLDTSGYNVLREFVLNHPEATTIHNSQNQIVAHVVDITVSEGKPSPLSPWSVDQRTRRTVVVQSTVSSSFEWTATIVSCLVLSIILATLSICKIAYQQMNGVNSVYVNHSDSTHANHFNIPLNAASMGLSLTLLLCMALTAFLLTHEAGKSSTETARDDGDAAVEETFNNAVSNINELNNRWLRTILESAASSVDTFFTDGERYVSLAASTLVGYDGTYDWFSGSFDVIGATFRDIPWNLNIKTIEGYYMDSHHITDPLPFDLSDPNSDPRDNFISSYAYNINERRMALEIRHTREEFNPDVLIGESFGDPFEATRSLMESEKTWVAKTYSFPQINTADINSRAYSGSRSTHPFSVLGAILDQQGNYRGAVEGMRSMADLSNDILTSINEYPSIDNITVFLIDKSTGVIICSSFSNSREIDQFLGTSYVSSRESFSIENTYQTEINALGSFLKQQYNGSLSNVANGLVEGEFDEAVYYNHNASGWEQAVFTFDNGVTDVTENNYKTEVRGGSCHNSGCVVASDRPNGGNCLQMDGQSTFYIYFNLTTDTPRVAGTRLPTTDGSWQSSFPLFNSSQTAPDGSEIIMYRNPLAGTLSPVLREPLVTQPITISVWINPEEDLLSGLPTDKSPRIFSDTAVGNAAIRWYADARLYLGIVNFGCITDPITMIPSKQWTHLIATIDRKVDQTCSVYVNGSLHSKKEISPTVESERHDEPYRVGEYFKGMIDDFMILNTSISDGEAEKLFQDGKFNRIVPSKMWSFTSRTASHASLSYLMGVMLPTDDILNQVIANNELTRSNLDIQRSDTDNKLNKKTYETVFVLTALALFSVLVFITFNDMLTKPFAEFAVQLSDAAIMKCDSVDQEASYYIREMNALHRSMILMINNLREYKSYMPVALTVLHDDTSDEEDVTIMSETASIGRGKRSSRGSSHSFSASTHQSSTTRTIEFADAKFGTQVSLHLKKVSLTAVNIVGFHGVPDGNQISTHQDYLTAVLNEANCLKGVPDTFVGDKILVSFNAVRACAGHRAAVLRFVLNMQQVLNSIEGVSTSCGAGSGSMRCGNVGIERMKHYSFLSPVVTWVYTLERLAKALGQYNLVDNHLKNDAAYKYTTKTIGWMKFSKLSKVKPQKMTTILSLRTDEDNTEWMYQIQNAARLDSWHSWNEAAECLFNGTPADLGSLNDDAQREEFRRLFAAQLVDRTSNTKVDLNSML